MKFLFFVMTTIVILSLPVVACGPDGSGIVEENDLWIPEGMAVRSSMTHDEFDRILDRIEEIYAPIIKEKGGVLSIARKWSDGKVNAFATRKGDTWQISMYGGLARHKAITSDGFALVACHELGHHLGGAPRLGGGWLNLNTWASNEGQSDYFATTKCFRRYVERDDNVEMMKEQVASVPERARVFCQLSHPDNEVDIAICQRATLAGLSLGTLFSRLSKKPDVSLKTPVKREASKTNNKHPAAQCRLDTYFQGALCYKSYDEVISGTDSSVGYCSRQRREHNGVRSRCWFYPEDSTLLRSFEGIAAAY